MSTAETPTILTDEEMRHLSNKEYVGSVVLISPPDRLKGTTPQIWYPLDRLLSTIDHYKALSTVRVDAEVDHDAIRRVREHVGSCHRKGHHIVSAQAYDVGKLLAAFDMYAQERDSIRALALADAAKAADKRNERKNNSEGGCCYQVQCSTAQEIASAIRAMVSP